MAVSHVEVEAVRHADEAGHVVGRGLLEYSLRGVELLDLPVADRLEGTAATVVGAVLRGADIVRVHDVRQMVRAVRVADRMR